MYSRSLRGNVDRNSIILMEKVGKTQVVPYVGTWIEICLAAKIRSYHQASSPTWERG